MVSVKEKSGKNSSNLLRVKKGLKKKKKAFELDVDACMIIYDPTLVDVALQKEEGFLFNFEIEEDLKDEFMGFDELNVKINQMRVTEEEEEENLLDSSLEFLMEGDNCTWPSDELDEILNAFGDNCSWSSDELNEIVNGFGGDNTDHNEDNIFDLLAPLSDPSCLPLTNAFIDNILNTSSDDWPAGTMVEWDQLFS